MKTVFLDIDGVLNSKEWYMGETNPGNIGGNEGDIDPDCVERVKKICEETGAKIVLSSDWKMAWPGAKIRLENAGFPRGLIIDKTPDLIRRVMSRRDYMLDNSEEVAYLNSRGCEIDGWLKEHPECTNFVIIDDRTDFTEEQQPHFIHTDWEVGITDDNVNIAILTLNHH